MIVCCYILVNKFRTTLKNVQSEDDKCAFMPYTSLLLPSGMIAQDLDKNIYSQRNLQFLRNFWKPSQ